MVHKYALSVPLAGAIAAGAVAALVACGSSNQNSGFNPGSEGDGSIDGTTGDDGGGDSGNQLFGDGGSREAGASVLSKVHIVPANAKITVQGGQTATQAYKVMGIVDGATTESDVTSHFVFWVPDNYLVGDFPANGGPLFKTRLPVLPTDPPQQGGLLTIEAEALNPGNVKVTTTTGLTVQLVANLDYPSEGPDGGAIDAGLPPNPGNLFGGPSDPARAPVLEYPNDGTMQCRCNCGSDARDRCCS